MTGHTNNNWWFRINWWGTCTAATTGTVGNIRGYTGGPHSVAAYSDSNCATQIASTTFTVQTPSLTATVDNDRSVDLSLANGPNNWWFRIGWGTCTAATGTTFSDIRGYAAGTYIVVATADSACTEHVATTAFTIPTATLATTVNSDRSVDLTLTNGPGNWWFRINSWGTCTAVSGTSYNNIRGYAVGTHSVKAYSNNGCNAHIASSEFTIQAATLTATVDPADWSVDLALNNGPSNWWFRINSWGTCTAVSGTSYNNIRGYRSGTHVVAVFPDSNCGSHGAIAGATFVIPSATLTVAVDSDRSFDLTLANGPTNWWFRINYIGTCTQAAGNTVSDIRGYLPGTHVVHAYTGSGCNHLVAWSSFTIIDPVLTVSNIDVTTATLNIAHHNGAWHYMANTGPDNTCQGPVTAGTKTKDLTGLSANTSYDYSAYSDSTCTTAKRLATAATFTTRISVSNLAQARVGRFEIGRVDTKKYSGATGFTTGSNSGGYNLQSVTVSMGSSVGSPTGFTAAIHASSGGNPATTATYALSGSSQPADGDYTYTCSGACRLDASATYFLVMSATGPNSGNHYYLADNTLSDSEANAPTGAGWSIANSSTYKENDSDNWGVNTSPRVHQFTVTAAVRSLSASSITETGATLTIANHSGDWWYKATNGGGPHTTCQGPVSGTSATLTGLSVGTTYTYTAYSDSGCSTVWSSVTFTSTGVSVSNLDETTALNYNVAHLSGAAGFTTGSNSGGYTLKSVTVKIVAAEGSPTATAAIYAESGGVPAGSATYTLSGDDPTVAGNHTWSCVVTADVTCSLDASTDYFLVLSTANGSLLLYYSVATTTSGDETNAPADAGWSIADVYKRGPNPWDEPTPSDSTLQFKVTAVAK